MKNIKHIFFDLDHTLWHFEKNSSLTFKFLLNKYGINIGFKDFLKIYMPINFSLWNLYRDDARSVLAHLIWSIDCFVHDIKNRKTRFLCLQKCASKN